MPKKGENIYQRKDGRWEGRYCDGKKLNGKKKYMSIYGHSYMEVKAKLNEKKAAAAAVSGHVNAKLHEVASKWLEHVRLHVKDSTFTTYSYLLNKHILPLLGERRIMELDSAVINEFIDEKLKNGRLKRIGGISKKYLQDILAIVKAIVKYAEQEYGIQNKVRNTAKLRIEKREMRTLNEEDEKRLTKKLIKNPTPYNAGILLALYTGIRIGEVCGLRWEDFDEKEKIIRIRRTVQRVSDNNGSTHLSIDKPKTAASIRVIPLPEFLWKLLKEMRGDNTGAIVSENGEITEPWRLRKYFNKILDICEIARIRFHDLRHTFATKCIRLNFDIKTLSEILGHTNISMTLNRYVHSSMNVKKEYMQLLTV